MTYNVKDHEAMDLMYAVGARLSERGAEAEAEWLQRSYDEALKECLGQFLPIQYEGKMLSLGDLRNQLRTGLPYKPKAPLWDCPECGSRHGCGCSTCHNPMCASGKGPNEQW